MEEVVKAVNVYEKDGVVVEETIEVPVDELETLKEYMGVNDDNQEEYMAEADREVEDISDVEEDEGYSEDEDESDYDEPEEVEVIEDEATIEFIGEDGIYIDDQDEPIFGVPMLDPDDILLSEEDLDIDIVDDDEEERLF